MTANEGNHRTGDSLADRHAPSKRKARRVPNAGRVSRPEFRNRVRRPARNKRSTADSPNDSLPAAAVATLSASAETVASDAIAVERPPHKRTRRQLPTGERRAEPSRKLAPKTIELALQGGGSHGAFSWGVLDRLLEDDRVRIGAICGTSAGAMNAVVLADGLDRQGKQGAREALERFWRKVSQAAMFSPIQRTPLDRLLGRWSMDSSPAYIMLDLLSRTFSPYDFNPLNMNPLRDLIASLVDFDHVRHASGIKLYVAATNVRTGKLKVFGREEMTADMVMASACLPFLYQAVEIDGEAYWDGGYMGNPALFPLVEDTQSRDVVIVQINPIYRQDIPRRAADILNRINEITFNASLIKDLLSITYLKRLVDAEGLARDRYKSTFLHRINAEEELLPLSVSSKLNAEWAFLKHLHDIGYRAASAWLDENHEALGRRSTLNIDQVYF